MKNRDRFFLVCGFFAMLILPCVCLADEAKTDGIVGIEFFTGYAKADLHQKSDYAMSPFIVDIDYNLKNLTKNIGIDPPSMIQFQLEPFISPVYEPDSNVEFGNGFAFKFGLLPETSKFQPYVKACIGMLYMTQHTREQSTQFNFFEYGGAGMHYFFSEKLALTVELRFRHISNASIKEPNHGINSQFALLGLAYKF